MTRDEVKKKAGGEQDGEWTPARCSPSQFLCLFAEFIHVS